MPAPNMPVDPGRLRQNHLRKSPPKGCSTAGMLDQTGQVEAIACVQGCLENGYAPRGYGLADFTIIHTGGLWHLFHIPRVMHKDCWGYFPANEHWFGHAVSRDLDTWITLHPVLANQPGLPYEHAHIWAPFVTEHQGVFYMFYAGIANPVPGRLAWPDSKAAAGPPSPVSQSLCLATSTDPELQIWTRFAGNPIHTGGDWHFRNPNGAVHNMRDPHVLRVDSHFLLVYTAMYKNGCPAVGGLVSTDLGHWEDIGPVLYRPMPPYPWHPESVNVQPLPDGTWVMLPSCSPGLEYRISADPHDWHGTTAALVAYADGDQNQPGGLEILRRHDQDGLWLVAWFEGNNNRLFIGELDISAKPWQLRRIRERDRLQKWTNSR